MTSLDPTSLMFHFAAYSAMQTRDTHSASPPLPAQVKIGEHMNVIDVPLFLSVHLTRLQEGGRLAVLAEENLNLIINAMKSPAVEG